MKYLPALLILFTLNCAAQSYQAQIADFRKNYADEFLKDSSSPLKKDDLQYLRFYDADSTYRVEATAQLLPAAPGFIIPAYTGGGRQYTRYALLNFTFNGKPAQLTVYRNVALAQIDGYKDYLFLPFTDETNGKDTYGGGRYIDLREADFKGNKLILDFNKAYNPYCAFGSGYSCPKPPDENHLPMMIPAGEKLFAKAVSH